MKSMKKTVSYILFIAFGVTTIFNILFMFKMIGETLLWAEFIIFLLLIFAVSAFGIMVKNIRKDDAVSINIITPVKEIGKLYVFMLIAWVISYFIVMVFR